MDRDLENRLRALPSVDLVMSLLEEKGMAGSVPRSVLLRCARSAVDEIREKIRAGLGSLDQGALQEEAAALAGKKIVLDMRPSLKPVVNGTGVVVHTNLGRSPLAEAARAHVLAVAAGYSSLEYDIGQGRRGSRNAHVEELLRELTGAEAALVVNNNAGAVLLCLDTLASGKKVVVSRGELVEIGGSFRIPDVMAKSGAILKEVGTTNRTHLFDYESAIDAETALLFKAHTSNFAVVGFTASVPLSELAGLAHARGIRAMEDLGSGSLVDLSVYGLAREPTVQDSVSSGVDIVTFSGDKVLGGPQAGIIVGKQDAVGIVRKNPLARALRMDKLTLAALEATLRLYRDPEQAVRDIPTLRMLTTDLKTLNRRAAGLARRLNKHDKVSAKTVRLSGRVGGGALPLQDLPGAGVAIQVEGLSAKALEERMRKSDPPVIGRIEQDVFLLDVRTLSDDDPRAIERAVNDILEEAMER